MKKKGVLAAYISVVSMLLLSMVVSSTVARYVKDAESGGSYGEVSIRSYYDSGTGTLGDPFRITRPNHLYNLSRLQGLGCYSGSGEKKTYFQLGKETEIDGETVYRCYASDTSQTLDRDYLDMRDYSRPIEAIGSETTPFYGDFDGKNLEIRNLTVYADPEDAGLFGYTAHASKVHDLFLENITINTKGYAKNDTGLSNLYSGAVSEFNPSFSYTNTAASWNYTPASSPSNYADKTYSFTVDWATEKTANQGPAVSWATNYQGSGTFKYKLLPSGGLLSDPPEDTTGTFGVDTDAVIEYFAEGKTKSDAIYPLTASSSMSILAYMTNNGGYLRSRVLLTLKFDFSLASSTSNIITLSIHTTRPHGNNIGLIIGHCDGTVENCYVHDGQFVMNDGSTETYQGMANGSDTGLIGVQGNTVKNIASQDSGASAREGKTVGFLDFSNVYKTITGKSATYTPVFTQSSRSDRKYTDDSDVEHYSWTYTPNSDPSNDYYKSMLRRVTEGGTPTYYTADDNTVTFKGQEVIQGNDLGVFKIATDHMSDGVETNAMDSGMAHTVIRDEAPQSYLYYAIGEYRKNNDDGTDSGESFADYRDSLSSNLSTLPTRVLPGYHFPRLNQTTWRSFSSREMLQNYIFRFKMNTGRTGFYFSDLDRETNGGDFLTKYLEYKLVDENNNHSYVDENDDHVTSSACGVTFKDRVTKLELGELSASFATRDLSKTTVESNKMWCIDNAAERYPVANMVNFEVTTKWANVTIVAAPKDTGKPAALGVYKINPQSDYKTYAVAGTTITYKYVDRDFDKPDYAFFMPDDNNLAYFDYKVCSVDNNGTEISGTSNSKGRIGTYKNGVFTQATYGTSATTAGSEYDHVANSPRLFVHTFKLPKGRYCVGSPTGTSSFKRVGTDVNLGLSSAKIYYVCAQGQDEGDADFVDNIYGEDTIDNIDFVKTGRSGIKITGWDTIGQGDSDKLLQYQRCYVMLAEKKRSNFSAGTGILSFTYANGVMNILAGQNNATLSAMTNVAVASYGSRYGLDETHPVSDLGNTGVLLFTSTEADYNDLIVYPKEST